MRRSILKQRQFGFSLMEIIVALGIGSVLILFSGNLLVSSKMQEQRASITSEVDRIHLINLQRSRNPRFLADKNLIFAGLNAAQKKNAELCMTGKVPAGGCTGFNQAENAATVFADETPSQYFRSTISARRMCDARGCHKIEIEVKTGDSNPGDKYDIFERKSVGYLPAFSFASTSDMDMNCGSEVMGALNYYQMQPECGNLPGNFTCNNGDRIMNVGFGGAVVNPSLCSGMARRDCTAANEYGLSVTGVLSGQQFCQGPAATIGSGCVPSWTPRPEDMCAGVPYPQNDGCGNSRSVLGTGDCSNPSYPSTTASGPYTPPPTTPPPTSTTRPATTTTAAATTTTGAGPTTTTGAPTTTTPIGSCRGRILFPYAGGTGMNCVSVSASQNDTCLDTICTSAQNGDVLYRPCANMACMCSCFGFPTTTRPPTTTTVATTTTTRPPTTTTAAPTCVAVPRYGWCFAAGTLVTMADGSKKSIEQVKLGEQVVIFDELTGARTHSAVTEVLHHPPREQLMYKFVFSDGSSFTVTGEHLIYTVEDGYIAAVWLSRDVQIGRSIHVLSEQRKETAISSVTVLETNEPTYNIHVAGISGAEHERNRGHNYFANGILAHNMKACCGRACQECQDQGRTGCVTSMPPGRFPGTGVNCRSDYVDTDFDYDPCNEEGVSYQVCRQADPMCP